MRGRRVATGLPLTLLVTAQFAKALASNRAWHRQLGTREPAHFYGRGVETWFGYFRRIRTQTPAACGHIFAFNELAHAPYALKISAALSSELPDAVVLGNQNAIKDWPRPLSLHSLGETRATLRGCEWMSNEARRALTD